MRFRNTPRSSRTNSTEPLLTRLDWRYATRAFDPARTITAATWASLERVLVLGSSSYGLEPWRLVVVREPALRARLASASPTESAGSHLVVFARKDAMSDADIDRLVARTTEARGVPGDSLRGESGPAGERGPARPRSRWIREWTGRQTYIALGNLMTSAALRGVDACPVAGIDADHYDDVLGLADTGYSTLCACEFGHRPAAEGGGARPPHRTSPASAPGGTAPLTNFPP